MGQVSRVALILAGGTGERFWPLSTPERPKQLLKLTSADKTLLEEVLDRAHALVSPAHTFIVTGPRIGEAIAMTSLIETGHIFVEPVPKNTLGALCWTIAQLRARGYSDETTMAILPADHAIPDVAVFVQAAQSAMSLAEETGGLVTIGVQPTRIETGYGYIHRGEPVGSGFKVLRFAEKPNTQLAKEYVDSGEFFWNSGMFFWTIGGVMAELHRHTPDAAAIIERLPTDPGAFADLTSIAVDRALMERSDKIFVVPAQFSWDDVGAWDALERTNIPDEKGNVLVGDSIEIDSSGCLVYSEGIPIGILGIQDIVVVATKIGVLVCHKSEAQRVREVLARLNENRESPK